VNGRAATAAPADAPARRWSRRGVTRRRRDAARELTGEDRRRSLSRLARALGQLPRAAWACMLVATVNAACWSLITPPFQAPDEPSHFAYVQLLAETGRLPNSNRSDFSREEIAVMFALHQSQVEWHPEVGTISSQEARAGLSEVLKEPLSRVGGGGAGVAASEPPLFYAIETIPYYIGSAGTLLDRLELMRLCTALMAGLTALFMFMFVREALPGRRWAWTVGGLAVAAAPLLGFTSGVVTPDALLYTVSAAVFFNIARAFRRGLTRKRALALGVLTAAGFLTKVNFIGMAPGALLAIVILGVRGSPDAQADGDRRALGAMAIALGLGLSPVVAYVLDNVLFGHHALGIVTGAATVANQESASAAGAINYVWDLYLPHLPGTTNYFPGLSTIRQLWFNRWVGLYGWLDTTFPPWVYTAALIPAGSIALLAVRGLVVERAALRRHALELLVYAVIAGGLMSVIGVDSYLHRAGEGGGYAQPRYLMPLLPLLAVGFALAARGAGKRWGPTVGALIVLVVFAHDIFSQLLVASRFYG
jgi:hypothetical protein